MSQAMHNDKKAQAQQDKVEKKKGHALLMSAHSIYLMPF